MRAVAAGDGWLDPGVCGRVLRRYRGDPGTDPAARRRLHTLTSRELEVLRLIGRGLSNAEIAKRLFVGEGTVKTHLGRVFTELAARDRAASDRVPTRAVWATILILILIILAFAANRVSVDWPNVAAGSVPPTGSFDHRYALHPALAYVHIVPGVVYLVGAPFQLSRRFRERHFTVHRRMGRVVLPAGITTGASRSFSERCSRLAGCSRRAPRSCSGSTS